MIVVPVLMTSCQVSLKPNTGPVTIHTATASRASMKILGPPQTRAAAFASLEYQVVSCMGALGEV